MHFEPDEVQTERQQMIHPYQVIRFDFGVVLFEELIPRFQARLGCSGIKKTQFEVMPCAHRLKVLFGVGLACTTFGHDMTVAAHPVQKEREHFGDIIGRAHGPHFRIKTLTWTTYIVAIDIQFGLRWIIVFPYYCCFVCCQFWPLDCTTKKR